MGALTLALPPSPLCDRCGHQLCPSCVGPWCDMACHPEVGCHPEGWSAGRRTPHEADESELPCAEKCCGQVGCIVDAPDFDRWQRELDQHNESVSFGNVQIVELGAGPWLPEAERLERTRGERHRILETVSKDVRKMAALYSALTQTLTNLLPGASEGTIPEQPLLWIQNIARELGVRGVIVAKTIEELRPFISKSQTEKLAETLRKDTACEAPPN